MNRKKYFFVLCALLVAAVTVLVSIVAGKNSYGMEGDEVFSYISANSMGGFKGICFLEDQTWYDAAYFTDALTATGKECFNIKMVIENQAMDTHPPLFYLCMNFICSVFEGKFSKWFGIGLNIFFLLLLEGALFLLLQHFLDNQYMSLFLSMVFCCSRLSVNMVLFIRMYVLLMASIVFQLWFHLKLYERMETDDDGLPVRRNFKSYLCLGVLTVAGALTHYYFLVYQSLLAAVFMWRVWRQRKCKAALRYAGTMAVSGALYLCMYPAVLNHIFFKYRGRDAVHKFLKEGSLFGEAVSMFRTFDEQLFKGTLPFLLLLLMGVTLFLGIRKKVSREEVVRGTALVMPAVAYFYVVSRASPFVTVRYVSPVAPVLFAVLAVWAEYVCRRMGGRWIRRFGSTAICAVLFLTSFCFWGYPIKEAYFLERKEIVDSLAEHTSCCMYVTGDEYNWKMWEDYVIYPQFDALFFVDGRKRENITDEEIRRQRNLAVFVDNSLDYEETIDYLQKQLCIQNYEILYQTPYIYIIRGW